ncbi:DUF2726 domain-containing protein [Methylibium rhizosphaerae]|uniref:DUF2726 domain-containing protein n=1 Tax=Methylibium rhizosphaerae TaxID=2570323 RepID=UPI001129211A|nr:DUF2726 domain-containing protein [Methylibium rhizosphaerae]
MDPLLIGLVVVAVLAVLWLATRKRQPAAPAAKPKAKALDALDTVVAWPPSATRLMTNSERKAYAVLRTALPEHMVLAQVPLARFIKVPTRYSYAEWMRRAGQLCVDLLVCDSSSQVVAVVDVRQADIDESERAHKRHARMDRVLKAAGIPVHVWREGHLPSANAAREQVLQGMPPELSQQEGGASVRTRSAAARLAPSLDSGLEDDDAVPRDPPPSTWFDELDSAPAPLDGGAPTNRPGPRP